MTSQSKYLLVIISIAWFSFTSSITIKNPSFETTGDWDGSWTKENNELFAPPNGDSFAQLLEGSIISQNIGILEANKVYSFVVWARSTNAHIPDTSGSDRGKQKTHVNLLSKAKLTLRLDDDESEISSAEIVVSPNSTAVSGGKNEHDDGANVFIAGNHRIHLGNSILYQSIASDPIADPWIQGTKLDTDWGLAVGPVSDLNGTLIIKALGGGFTKTDLTQFEKNQGIQVTSRIELVPLLGTEPNYSVPAPSGEDEAGAIFNTVLKHVGDESPWVFDAHYCYDDETEKLWMTWGGHSGFITEVDSSTGKVIDPSTGSEPPSLEFNSHAEGVHTKILTNQKWDGLQMYSSNLEAPGPYEGDEYSTQAYMEGLGLLKHGNFFFACGTYGSMEDSYTIRCCRQNSSEPNAPRGPYKDKNNKRCAEFDTADGRYPSSMLLGPDGDHLVPGHPHFWREYGQGGEEMVFLGYDHRTEIPSVKEDAMAIRRLFFDNDGWPTIWMPIHARVDTGALPDLVGKQVKLELSSSGDNLSKIAFDHVEISDGQFTTYNPTTQITAKPTIPTLPTSMPTLPPVLTATVYIGDIIVGSKPVGSKKWKPNLSFYIMKSSSADPVKGVKATIKFTAGSKLKIKSCKSKSNGSCVFKLPNIPNKFDSIDVVVKSVNWKNGEYNSGLNTEFDNCPVFSTDCETLPIFK